MMWTLNARRDIRAGDKDIVFSHGVNVSRWGVSSQRCTETEITDEAGIDSAKTTTLRLESTI